jgi:hypothetical protein
MLMPRLTASRLTAIAALRRSGRRRSREHGHSGWARGVGHDGPEEHEDQDDDEVLRERDDEQDDPRERQRRAKDDEWPHAVGESSGDRAVTSPPTP